MKAVTLVILVSALVVILVRGAFNLLISPFLSAVCEAD